MKLSSQIKPINSLKSPTAEIVGTLLAQGERLVITQKGETKVVPGYPKLIPRELVRRAETGEQFKVNLFAGASIGVEFRQPSIYP
ncbi:MAG: hypothetical protein EOM37_15725 [Proteobacteria bacterium]|nr:hypothetical protein [Pseudomonadota bacterium]